MSVRDKPKRGKARVRLAIIGAGLGGVAAAVKFEQAGFTNFTVFEQSAGPGGVWFDNTYPGCEVDIWSHLYSYSFMPFDWSRTHATQPEIKRYIDGTLDAFGIRDRFRFLTQVEEVVWQENSSTYGVRLAGGEVHEFDMVVSAVGILNRPKYPTWPGLDSFSGPKFHTSRWDHGVDLTGKRVALVGTGSTGVQITSSIAPIVDQLILFQREPAWVIPKGDRDFTHEERKAYRESALVRMWKRYKLFRSMGRLVKSARVAGTPGNKRFHEIGLAYLNKTVRDPEKRKALAPSYPFGCKRIVQCSKFYTAMDRDNVSLVPFAVERITPTGVVAANGVEYPVDVLVIGTGFHAQDFLASFRLVGAKGRTLHEKWGASAKAFLGLTVPDFPNFAMLYGPNTNGGASIIYQHERQAESAVRMAKKIMRGRVVDTREDALTRYTSWIDRTNAKYLSATFHCNNYFYASDRRNVTQWPLSALRYSMMLRFLLPFATKVRRARKAR